MMIKKIISVISALIIFVNTLPASYISYAEDNHILLNVSKHETVEYVKNLLESDVVFMTSVGYFFANGKKQSYSSVGARDAYYKDGKVMVDVNLLETLFDLNDIAIDYVSEGEADFADASAVAKAVGKTVYDTDNRNFIIVSDTDNGYTNHILAQNNQENTDKIWRYMQFERPDGDSIYNSLIYSDNYKKHPRLFIKKDDISDFKDRVYNNAELKSVLDSVLAKADRLLGLEPQKYTIGNDNFRLYGSCETVKDRLFYLCLAYLLTDDTEKKESYAQRAWKEIDNACNWKDWNTRVHFLDSGEIGPGIAFAYDVLYDWLGADRRLSIRNRVTELYLNDCVDVYTGDFTGGYDATGKRNISSNWGAVNATSMLMLSLTFMDEEEQDSALTQKCKYIAANSLQTYEHILTSLAPEGTWSEGAGYYEFVQQHLAWLLISLNNIFGVEDYNNFLSVPGIDTTVEYQMHTTTVNGSFNKAATTGVQKCFAPETFVFAKLLGRGDLMAAYKDFRNSVEISSFLPSFLLFYDPGFAFENRDTLPKLDRYYSSNGTGVMRGSWFNPEGTYAAVSGGATANVYNDTHYDKGSFIFEAIGERWSIDLGRNGNNTMPFLYRTESHSALVINPDSANKGQLLNKIAYAIRNESTDKASVMVYDLSGVYEDWVNNYKRGFLFGEDRNTLIIQDELTLKNNNPLVWNMVTKANIEISDDGKSAILTQNGKKLLVSAYCTEDNWSLSVSEDMAPTGGWTFVSGDDDNDPTDSFTVDDQKNFAAGARKLRLIAQGSDDVVISVKLTPVIEGDSFSPLEYMPISGWTLPEGEREYIIRFTDIKNRENFISDKPVYFSVNVDGKFESLTAKLDGKIIDIVTEHNNSCYYSFKIPAEYFSCAGDSILTLEANYKNYSVKKDFNLNIQKVHSTNSKFSINFDSYPDTYTDHNSLVKALGLSGIDLKNGTGKLSKVEGIGGSGSALKFNLLSKNGSPYIQKYHERLGENDIIHISYDVIPNSQDLRLFMSFKKDENSIGAHDIFKNNGYLLNTDIQYVPDKLYHVEFIVDKLTHTYRIMITDQKGLLIAEERDKFDASYGYTNDYCRLTFSTSYSGTEERYFIVDNFNLSSYQYTSLQTNKATIDDDVLDVEQSFFSNKFKSSELKYYIAYYDSEGLVDVVPREVSGKEINFSENLNDEIKYIKILLWTDELTPIIKSINVTR